MPHSRIYKLLTVLFLVVASPLLRAQNAPIPHPTAPYNTAKQIDSVINAGMLTHRQQTYFATLYQTIANKIHTANQKHQFTDSGLIDYIQQQFTVYYLQALAKYTVGDSLPFAWKAALDSQYCKNCSYAQWLALGTNAHINHDLYFILLNYFKTNGTEGHNGKQARKTFLTISAKETDRIVLNFISTDPNISFFEGLLLKTGKGSVKRQMGRYMKTTWNRALKAAQHPEQENALTQKQTEYCNSNANRLLHPTFPLKIGFNILKSIDRLPFDTKLNMLKPQ